MYQKLSFGEVLALSPDEYTAYKEWLETQKDEAQQAAEYKEYLRLVGADEDEGRV